ncbi:glycosyltransferase family 2 protein [Jannaschia sp. CCS1]|uniref:glycosyltransferase family 2 protein n=1 Tax=Jannaschia sp. (strain CCS1) TaxID=290400 RepID=UPI000053CB90|nr:glycosyltransferase family 2 protein [Jannaschia sp. CCS1]ABD57172.1 glycosyl transferase family 2 [Jannaschia sp. CCS1]
MRTTVVISIINYRTKDLTIASAQSALRDLAGINGEVVIVDNRSEDGSADAIEAWITGLPQDSPVRLIRSATNSGFSGGHNQIIAATDAEFYLILNSDATLEPGFLTTILNVAAAAPEAGIFAPHVESENGQPEHTFFRFPSPVSEFIRGANTQLVTRLFGAWDVPLGLDPAPEKIDWVSFPCVLVRAEMVRDIGPMDEGYFLYFEDTEYCLRAGRASWGIVRAPEARAVHLKGQSGPVNAFQTARKRLPSYYYSSRTRFLYQAHGLIGVWAANILWTLGRGIAGTRRLLGRRRDNLKAGEARDIWTNIRTPLEANYAPVPGFSEGRTPDPKSGPVP